MIIQLQPGIKPEQKTAVTDKLKHLGLKTKEVSTQQAHYLVNLGKVEGDIRELGHMEGIRDVHVVSDNFMLVSGKWKVGTTKVDLGDKAIIGDGSLGIIAGPCSIEGEQQVDDVIAHLKSNDVRMMRGGVYKPRSSPYSFRGVGIEGLKMWHEKAAAANIKIVTEVMQSSQIEEMYDYVDIFQVGARNTQNYNLLDALGQVDKPVMIKRGISGTLEELLYSAEYVFSGGNEKLLLCERGIRTYEKATRNTLDLNAVPWLKEKTHLPVVVDPSHGIGIRRYVSQMALAGAIAGADAIIYETHQVPEEAFSDGQQTLDFEQSAALISKLRQVERLRANF